ncbi:E3 ubiquitin-protein ligase At1g63170-like [Coffea arabica]|uniref:E3 ubiquitin-protein ligase At1g63170-like n=1 Tax=Coffea arabica TaxID=13443 RepID=A0A6P6T3R7_COFAR|nr:E3 ubiquitin-protein ligase At1g63170-like [Coffea arabica]
MAVTSQETGRENPTDRFPLLMEQAENRESNDHVIDIGRVGDASSPDSSDHGSPCGLTTPHHETGPSGRGQVPLTQSPSASNGSNFRSSSLSRRGEGLGRRWSPFNTVLWISLELVFTVGQIIAALVVLYLSRRENPQTPLFAWVVGYAAGCALSLPLYYWRYIHSNQITDQRSTQSRQGSRRGNSTSEPNSYITISLTRSSEEEAGQNTSTGAWNGQNNGAPNARVSILMDHFKMALDCFFAVWFVVGNVWIFGGHSSSSDAPNLYRLCLVFLTFSCIGYAMPFILCGMICCCLPCIIHILGVREDMNGVRGATEESINALPKYKFNLKRNRSSSSGDSSSGFEEGGFLAAGTEKERAISGEDAVCCICLTKYEDDDELRELPCSHFFHTECVDKWLKINASCPLCKFEIGGGGGGAEDAAPVEASQEDQGV